MPRAMPETPGVKTSGKKSGVPQPRIAKNAKRPLLQASKLPGKVSSPEAIILARENGRGKGKEEGGSLAPQQLADRGALVALSLRQSRSRPRRVETHLQQAPDLRFVGVTACRKVLLRARIYINESGGCEGVREREKMRLVKETCRGIIRGTQLRGW